MNYSFNKQFPKRFRHLRISHDIVRAAVKRIPRSRAGDAFRDRLEHGEGHSWSLHVDSEQGEVWVSSSYMWARHCFRVDDAAAGRLCTLFDIVEEW